MKKHLHLGLWGIGFLLLLIYAFYLALLPLPVEVVVVKPMTLAKTFTEEGTVVPLIERKLQTLSSGKVSKILVEEGDWVKKGQLLLQLDTKELDYQLAQLRGELASLQGQKKQTYQAPYVSQVAWQRLAIEQARIQAEAARDEYKRMAELYQAGAISKTAYDDSERSMRTVGNLLAQQEEALKLLKEQKTPPTGTGQYFVGLEEAAQAKINLLEHQKVRASLYAPFPGRVKEVEVKEEIFVTPDKVLITLFEPRDYQVEIFLLTEDVVHVAKGMEVQVIQENKAGDLVFAGVVEKIAPTAVEKVSPLGLIEQRTKVKVKITSDWSRLRPGYALDVKFTTYQEKNRLVVPEGTLFPYQGGEAVWVLRRGKALVQPVVRGFGTEEDVVIRKGLQPGDQVIRNPQTEGLKEGKRLAPIKQ